MNATPRNQTIYIYQVLTCKSLIWTPLTPCLNRPCLFFCDKISYSCGWNLTTVPALSVVFGLPLHVTG